MVISETSNLHPGEILAKNFLKPLGITAYRLSKDINIPQTRISQIIKTRRRITADTALRLSRYFGTTAKFWLGLQNIYDLKREAILNAEELAIIPKINLSNLRE